MVASSALDAFSSEKKRQSESILHFHCARATYSFNKGLVEFLDKNRWHGDCMN